MEDVEMLKNEYTFAVNSMVNVMEKMSYIPTFMQFKMGLPMKDYEIRLKRRR